MSICLCLLILDPSARTLESNIREVPEWRRRGDDRALLESRLGEILPLIFGQQA
jgi:hypothetical protein